MRYIPSVLSLFPTQFLSSVTRLGLIPHAQSPCHEFVVQHGPLCLQESSPTLTLISSKVRKRNATSAPTRQGVSRAHFSKHCEPLFIIGLIAGWSFVCVYFFHHCISLLSCHISLMQ